MIIIIIIVVVIIIIIITIIIIIIMMINTYIALHLLQYEPITSASQRVQ